MQGTNQQRKKALCIGINYRGHKGLGPLEGSINDAHEVQKFLRDCYGYKPENIVVLTDDNNDAAQRPTRENIIKAMKELVKDAKPNDYLFFHYSGHGYRIEDANGDESDTWDEAIDPVDCVEKQESGKIVGYITDDEMHEIMVKPLPAGCRLTAIIDSCRSGTALDLPYVYNTGGEVKGVEPGVNKRWSAADVVSWSGCKDSEGARDVTKGSQAFGAMSNAFITVLRSNRHHRLSFRQLLVGIRKDLKLKTHTQKPQFSCSHEMDMNLAFIC